MKLKDFFNIGDPLGINTYIPAAFGKKKPVTLQGPAPAPMSPYNPAQNPGASLPAKPTTGTPSGPVPSTTGTPLFTQPSTTNAPAPKPQVATAPQIPPQFLKEDGSFYTPDEIADNIASTMGGMKGRGDVGNIAAAEFGGFDRSASDLRTDATRINNTRNDIATGESDPYGIASRSGIAYTPAQLRAIESAMAGVYDPQLATVFSLLESRQAEDEASAQAQRDEAKMRLQSELDAEQPYTLGKDQVRYDGQGNPIAIGISSDTTGAGSVYSPGADPTADAYIKGLREGTYKASDIPDEYKNIVAQGMTATAPAISQAGRETLTVIDNLLNSGDAIKAVSGIPGVSSLFPGTEATQLRNYLKQLAGMMKLENRAQLKGSGAISDFEFRVLGDASSALGINDFGLSNLSEEDLKTQLGLLKLKLEVGETTLADDELQFLKDQGYSIDEIRAEGNPYSFSSVGNTTASGNVPQRNNNPGNVKSGGLADSLATGTDSQGHLVFPDAETGFKALTMDLIAKINGASRWLPRNPTIAQLGKVYAEDPNWPISVARMLGVDPATPTLSIPVTQLAQAVARQEGFYA